MSDVNVIEAVGKPAKKAKLGRKLLDDEYEVLIAEVQSRPPLWNDCHNDFKNSVVTRKLWNEVGAAINLSGEETKPKWKNLKDTFRKQLQKSQCKSGSAANNPSTKWKFHDIMMFCKDVVLPSPMIGNLTPSTVEEVLPDSDTNSQVQDDGDNTVFDAGASQQQESSQLPKTTQPISKTNDRFSRPHRAKSAGMKKNEIEMKLMKLEEKKIDAILNIQNKKEKDDDYLFFMSFMPFLKELNPFEKLQVRANIQAAIMDAYKNHEDRIAQERQYSSDLSFSTCTSAESSYSGQLTPLDADGEIDNICGVSNALLKFN